MIFLAFLVVLISAVVSSALIRMSIPVLSQRLLDQPNFRSSHRQPTPRGGGLVFVLVASITSGLAWMVGSSPASVPLPLLTAPLLGVPVALVGLLDDLHNLPASWRYGVQLATALVVILASPLVAPSFAVLPLLVLLLIAVTAVINFTNFMDGLDGLVAGCMAVSLTAAANQLSAPLPIWALLGSLLGFLIWNWSPAKVFMGDVGSTFLGTVFAVLVLQASSWSESLGLLLVATPLLGDACLCVPRRLMAGQRVFQAHRLHLFQRLHQAGWPHARVSSLYIAATSVLAMAHLLGGLPWVMYLATIELLIGIWLDQQVAVPFSVAADIES
jgi:Fuc2NAc and GlcNAc transferase